MLEKFILATLIAATFFSETILAQIGPSGLNRLLNQSTFGANSALTTHVQNTGYPSFLEAQFQTPSSPIPNIALQPTTRPPTCTGNCVRDFYTMYPLQVAFFQNALTGEDQVRQRVALALHETFVVSSLEVAQPGWMGPYLQILSDHAFGNYRDLLYAITLNPAMGVYLDMAGNNKNAPNENYAREVLQLFSIGLDLLNADGTPVLDASQNRVPAFNEAQVKALARVFTGWNLAAAPATGVPNYKDPMVLNENNHDLAAKTLLNGLTIPARRNGVADLNDALNNIFDHQNVGPFFGKLLIQHLVTSNPSPAYISRVGAAFSNNGSGVRGDLKAVIRAILLDPEATTGTSENSGKLLEPVLYITKLLRAFNTTSATTDFVLGDSYLAAEVRMGQDLYRPPSVFSYFSPEFQLPGNNIAAPEFALYSTTTAINRMNFAAQVTYKRMSTSSDRPRGTWLNLSAIAPLASSPFQLTGTLDTLMTNGKMSTQLRALLNNTLASMTSSNLEKAQRAVYLIATSPEFSVEGKITQ